jgi:hypothetical protein
MEPLLFADENAHSGAFSKRKGVKKENKKGVYGGFAPVWSKKFIFKWRG